MRIDRLPRLPPVCDHPTPDTPLNNFEVFTQTWAENYISFDLKHVNWNSIVSLEPPESCAWNAGGPTI